LSVWLILGHILFSACAYDVIAMIADGAHSTTCFRNGWNLTNFLRMCFSERICKISQYLMWAITWINPFLTHTVLARAAVAKVRLKSLFWELQLARILQQELCNLHNAQFMIQQYCALFHIQLHSLCQTTKENNITSNPFTYFRITLLLFYLYVIAHCLRKKPDEWKDKMYVIFNTSVSSQIHHKCFCVITATLSHHETTLSWTTLSLSQ